MILLHLFWFVVGLCSKRFYNGDSYEYIYLAENIKHGLYYGANAYLPVSDYLLTSRTPLYSILIAICYSIFGPHNLPLLLLQNILSIISCWMIYDLFQKRYPANTKWWIYILFIAFYPAQFLFATMIVPDHVLQFFLVLYFRELFLSIETPSNERLARMSLWLILATMTKPIVYPFLILHVLYAGWYFFKTKSARVFLIALIPLASIIGYGLWNKSRTGLYHISSVQSHNLLNFNARSFLIFRHGQAYSDSVLDIANKGLDAQKGLKDKYEFADKEARKIIKNDLAGYAFYHSKESARFFIEPGKIEIDLYTGEASYYFRPGGDSFYKQFREHGMNGAWNYIKGYPYLPFILLIVLFNVLRVLGWILFLFDRRYSSALKIFSGIYILYFAAVTGPVANTRYFLPILLILSCLSMLGFTGWIEQRKARKQVLPYVG